ncbi:MAG: transcriptional repressor [Clostridiales bacterium]|jgi:Fur family ferric uptake transcriptional regulator|nr:transcriptional repressor [Clostridiales bacterium]
MRKKSYHTKQREFLIEFFRRNADGCYLIGDIMAYAAAQNAAIGQTTVYRNLEMLVQEGVLLKHSLSPSGGAYFQYLDHERQAEPHYHLLCTSCGAVAHLDCGHILETAAHIRKAHGFVLDGQKTVFYGLCETCVDPDEGHS